MTASPSPSLDDENNGEWSTNRWSVTRNGPWHVTVSVRGGGRPRSYTNTEARELGAALLEASERGAAGLAVVELPALVAVDDVTEDSGEPCTRWEIEGGTTDLAVYSDEPGSVFASGEPITADAAEREAARWAAMAVKARVLAGGGS